mmetsp:Transcript_28358/g.42879  ORF Transcript_28358/g.42879 Transcript_28358/m.42879 type:complete len:80 (+) Transcript_28358:236-475(+)
MAIGRSAIRAVYNKEQNGKNRAKNIISFVLQQEKALSKLNVTPQQRRNIKELLTTKAFKRKRLSLPAYCTIYAIPEGKY